MNEIVLTLVHELKDGATEERDVFGTLSSAGQSEFFKASQNNMQAQLKITIWQSDYDGERKAIVNGEVFDIYRTFIVSDKIELFLGQRID